MKRSFALDGDSNVFLIKSLAGLPDSDESQWKAMIICKQMAFVAFSQLIEQGPSGMLCQCIFSITLSDVLLFASGNDRHFFIFGQISIKGIDQAV